MLERRTVDHAARRRRRRRRAAGRRRDGARLRGARRVPGADRRPRRRARGGGPDERGPGRRQRRASSLDTVGARYGFEPHILTGDEEARLTFLGATSERDPDDRTPTLVIDIGGGSTELVIGTGREMTFHVSNQAGVVRQTERHLHSDPPTPAELDALATRRPRDPRRRRARAASARVGGARDRRSPAPRPRLAAIAQELEPYDPDKVDGYRDRPHECRRILERLAALPLEQRRQVRGLHPDRAPTIVAGVIILLETLDAVRARASSRSQSTTSCAAPRSGSAACGLPRPPGN